TSAHLRWIAWRKGDRRRALLAAQLPWSPRTVLAFAYEWEEGPSPAPRWHGRLSDIDARQAAIQALVLRDPNLPPELTVILGALPEGATWPRTEATTAAYARVAGHEIEAGLRLAGSASEALGHLSRTGWAWRPIDQHAAAPALLAGPWPELASPGETPILAGALCHEEQAALARLWPSGWLTLRTSPGLCQAAGEEPALGILPAPVGYPQKVFGALRLAYAGYGDAQRWSVYAFGLPLAAGPAQAWLDQSVAGLQARGWAVTRDASQGFYAVRPTGQPGANILGFAVPVFENRTLFGLIADR
ncbi:MAG: hypothetical protein GXO36_05380, partial [Chloroflexi bacterium]|nr:hypothetical protein [Chloroflexota bacterium]